MSTASVARHRQNAAAKAATLAVDYFICPAHQTVIIASATTVGKLYQVTASGCTCSVGVQELLIDPPPGKPQADGESAEPPTCATNCIRAYSRAEAPPLLSPSPASLPLAY